jgi:hypothetical protein
MKKLIVIYLLSISISSYSQSDFSIGASIGVGKTLMAAPFGYSGFTSYRAGVVAQYNIVSFLSAVTEIGTESYAIRKQNTIAGNKIENIERFTTIDVPVMAKFSTGENIKPYFSFGVGPSFLLSAKGFSKGADNIPGSTSNPDAKTDVSEKYNSTYWSLYSVAGVDLKGEKVIPFIEFKLKHSITDVAPAFVYSPLNSITANIGFRF